MTMAPGLQGEPSGDLAIDVAVESVSDIKGRSPWEIVRRRLLRDKVTVIAGVIAALFVLMAVTSPILSSLGVIKPDATNPGLVTGLGSMPTGPWGGISWEHPLGVEPGTGRDLLARIVSGLTVSLVVALTATFVALLLGTALGLVSGFSGGRIDWAVSRLMDLVLSFPQTLMLLSLSTVLVTFFADLLHKSAADPVPIVLYMCLVLAVFGWPGLARIVRGQVLSLREREFVEAARSLGARDGRIYVKELLPHLWAPLLVWTTMTMPAYIAAEAALGFLGVGIQPPTASLGAILNDSVAYAPVDPAYFFFPGVTVFVVVLAFNLLGDGLRDALDPKAGR